MLEFDDKNYRVDFAGKALELQPLSYRLLKALAETPEQVCSVSDLIDKVWVNTQVSPETLKQRVFVLRKALDEVGFEGVTIQAVRGEGYRLIITVVEKASADTSETPTPKKAFKSKLKHQPRKFAILSLFCFALITFATYWFFIRTPDHTINNRVLLWSNLPSEQMHKSGQAVFETWRTMVAQQSEQGQLQLVLSNRMEDMLVPVQARRDRAGVISHFELIDTHEGQSARISIVEPRTAAVLRSDVIDLSNQQQVQDVLSAQFSALHRLIFTHRLCLTVEQRENSQAPIWQELRQIANQS